MPAGSFVDVHIANVPLESAEAILKQVKAAAKVATHQASQLEAVLCFQASISAKACHESSSRGLLLHEGWYKEDQPSGRDES